MAGGVNALRTSGPGWLCDLEAEGLVGDLEGKGTCGGLLGGCWKALGLCVALDTARVRLLRTSRLP